MNDYVRFCRCRNCSGKLGMRKKMESRASHVNLVQLPGGGGRGYSTDAWVGRWAQVLKP